LELEALQIVQIVMKMPRVLTLRVDEKLKPTCAFLLRELDMETFQLGKMVMRFPQVLGCSVEGKLKPIMQYFLKEVGVPREALAKRFKNQPSVLGLSLEFIKQRLQWLKARLEFSDDDVCLLCSRTLNIFQQGRPMLESKIDNLCAKLGLDRRRCGSLIKHFPQLLTISIQNVNETVEFVTQDMQRDIDDIVHFPRVLWCSMKNRLRPRYRRLKIMGLRQEDYSLSTLFGKTDEAFEQFLQRSLANSR